MTAPEHPLLDPRLSQTLRKGRGTMTRLAHRFEQAHREADAPPDHDLPDPDAPQVRVQQGPQMGLFV